MFFILVHSDFYGILLPDHVSYTNPEECDSTNKKNDNGELQEQELVLLLETIQSPTGGLQNQDSRQTALYGRPRQKILAKAIY